MGSLTGPHSPRRGKDGTREEVIEKFRDWIKDQDLLMQEIESLRGKTLGCWCSPQPCHGDVIVKILEETNEALD